MLALRVDKKKTAVREIDKPVAAGEALVRVVLSGICNTDLEIARGYAGFKGTIGHEFVGVVEESADEKLMGQRVVGEINAGCGKCELCAGVIRVTVRIALSSESSVATARMQSFYACLVTNLHALPDKIADEHAVFAEPLAAACGIMERVSIDKSQSVAVIGDGKLGLLCAQAIALTGAPVLLIGKHAEKLRIAERRGIETASPKVGTKRKREFDVVVEAIWLTFGLCWRSGNVAAPRHACYEVDVSGSGQIRGPRSSAVSCR